ncbi:NAD(P)-binding domain-containing protein [Devosia sp.]|uniref:NADPH-dependent F420 reductase n=1 Tax=Devosia sp. TaxID=1871048 RepID=UPI0025D1CC05|nr:NAD(P)-binding domain-containing protein [Devosia sp.]MCR6633391.1 NAD(P)-binding domain-containing protein [Devosia sp.]
MRIGVLGSGQVGGGIARKLASLGHDVMMGSRSAANKAADFPGIKLGTATEAAAHGEWVVNALPGETSLRVLGQCDIAGKILIDIGNYDSAVDQPIAIPLGEAIQKAHPETRVVKTLNSISAHLMVDPANLQQKHAVFIASNDEAAKREVTALLENFGWQDIIDLGDLGACRAMEQLIPLWMSLEQKFGGPQFNLAVIRG